MNVAPVLRRIWRNVSITPYLHAATIGTIAFSLLILGAFAIVYGNINDLIAEWQQNIRIVAYIGDGLPSGRIASLEREIGDIKGVEKIIYVSKDQALSQLREQMKNRSSLLEGLHENPLPASFEIRMADGWQGWDKVNLFVNKIKSFSEIKDVEYGQTWLYKFSGFIDFFKLVTVVMGVLVLATTVFVCANTIRLTLFSRGEELEIMRLVGATDAFVKTPFYVQNLIEGMLGGGGALGLLYFVYKLFLSRIQNIDMLFSAFQIRFLSLPEALGLLLTGMLIGWLGSFISMRQFFEH